MFIFGVSPTQRLILTLGISQMFFPSSENYCPVGVFFFNNQPVPTIHRQTSNIYLFKASLCQLVLIFVLSQLFSSVKTLNTFFNQEVHQQILYSIHILFWQGQIRFSNWFLWQRYLLRQDNITHQFILIFKFTEK